MKPSMKANYNLNEVTMLVEGYAELVNLKSRIWVLVRLADLQLSVRRLTKVHRDAILIYGILNLDSRSAAKLLGVSHTAVLNRYAGALEQLTFIMNGGI